jgi:hypothetical protein
MKYLKISLVVLFCLGAVTFMLFKDYEISGDPDWPKSIKAYYNPVTGKVRTVDTETGDTLFSYHVDAFVKPKIFQRDGNKWIVTFEKRSP